MSKTVARTTKTFATFVGSLIVKIQKSPAKRVVAFRILNRSNWRHHLMFIARTTRDKTIPTRKERIERQDSQSTKELIRAALQAGSASKSLQEADRG